MTAFADFADLQAAVVEYVGDTDIVEVMPRLVKLAESKLNHRLRTQDQITTTTVTIASGTANLPSGFLEAIGLYDGLGREYVQRTPQDARSSSLHRNWWAVQGDDIVAPGLEGDYAFQYYAQIPTLTASMTTSNWLLQKYPGLYLYAVAQEAAKYLGNPDLAMAASELARIEFDDLKSHDNRQRYSRLRVRVGGPTP